MPYQESLYFKTPQKCKKIWRYMPIDKFMAMLSEESLYFPNVYLFNDRYEGILSNESLREVYKTDLLNAENTPVKQDAEFIEQKGFIVIYCSRTFDSIIEVKPKKWRKYLKRGYQSKLTYKPYSKRL